jgi:tRNA uridine 5-carbamoylmethylation protein Kti12
MGKVIDFEKHHSEKLSIDKFTNFLTSLRPTFVEDLKIIFDETDDGIKEVFKEIIRGDGEALIKRNRIKQIKRQYEGK